MERVEVHTALLPFFSSCLASAQRDSFKCPEGVRVLSTAISAIFHWNWWRLGSSVGKESACSAGDTEDVGSIPWSGRSPGEENGYPLQYSCLGNPMNRGAQQAAVHGVAKSQTRLSMHSCMACTSQAPSSLRVLDTQMEGQLLSKPQAGMTCSRVSSFLAPRSHVSFIFIMSLCLLSPLCS